MAIFYDTVREPGPRTMTRKYTSAVADGIVDLRSPLTAYPGRAKTRGPASAYRGSRLRGARTRAGPLLRVCLGLSRNSQSTPPRERAPPTKVPRAPDLRPGGAAGWARPVEPAACIPGPMVGSGGEAGCHGDSRDVAPAPCAHREPGQLLLPRPAMAGAYRCRVGRTSRGRRTFGPVLRWGAGVSLMAWVI